MADRPSVLPPSILFVCLGNICRSPMAEGAFRAAAAEAGLAVTCDSAGTGDWHVGNPPDNRAQAEMARHGIDISGLRARQIETADYYRFSHIFALDLDNLGAIRAGAPDDGTAEIGLLMDCVEGQQGAAVADPYFGDASGFGVTYGDVTAAAAALVSRFGG